MYFCYFCSIFFYSFQINIGTINKFTIMVCAKVVSNPYLRVHQKKLWTFTETTHTGPFIKSESNQLSLNAFQRGLSLIPSQGPKGRVGSLGIYSRKVQLHVVPDHAKATCFYRRLSHVHNQQVSPVPVLYAIYYIHFNISMCNTFCTWFTMIQLFTSSGSCYCDTVCNFLKFLCPQGN